MEENRKPEETKIQSGGARQCLRIFRKRLKRGYTAVRRTIRRGCLRIKREMPGRFSAFSRGMQVIVHRLHRAVLCLARGLRAIGSGLLRAVHWLHRLPWRKIWMGIGITAGIAVLVLAGTLWHLIATAPDIEAIDVSPSASATWICDSGGNYLRRLSLSDSNRDIVDVSEIPQTMTDAVIAIEDARFYEHNGIDLRAILRAAWTGVITGSFSEGASTITQQLIKNSIFTEWTQENSFADRFSRKVQEQYLAVQLEKQLSKDEILEDYLNTINFGSGCYGVQAAALRYFGKDVSELTLSESAVLAAIPQNPSGYNPIDYPEANQARQRLVLRYMEEQGYITHEERTAALSDDVYARISAWNASWEDESVYTYYEDALIDQVAEVLISELNYSSEQAYRAIYSGGLRIYSAQNAQLQAICDEEFLNPENFPDGTGYGIDYSLSIEGADGTTAWYGSELLRAYIRRTTDASFDLLCDTQEQAQTYADAFREYVLSENGEGSAVLSERITLSPQPQASLVLIEQETGFVRAIVGGRGEKTASLTLNRATDTTRQPGSTFKILTAYAPALDAAGQTLATLYENAPYEYENGTAVSNWDITDYSGAVTIREAITRSVNVAAVRCITEITPRLGFTYAERFGISTLVDTGESSDGTSDVIQPLALGGITNGVTNLELCAAYATIANGGMYTKPLFFTKILDRNGNVLLDYSGRSAAAAAAAEAAAEADPQSAPAADTSSQTAVSESEAGSFTRVLRENTAFLLTSAMQDVVSSPSGTAYGTITAAGQPVAGKTGTTSSYKDIWFVGYTPYYTCSVWGGYDNNQDLGSDSVSHSYSRLLWSAVMDRIHAALPAQEFIRPDSVQAVTLCSESHLPAQDSCPSTYTEYFAAGTAPQEACTLHGPESETEEILIYPDILEQLFPESEEETADAQEGAAGEETDATREPAEESEETERISDEQETESESEPDDGQQTESGQMNTEQAAETNSLEDLLNRLGKQGLH